MSENQECQELLKELISQPLSFNDDQDLKFDDLETYLDIFQRLFYKSHDSSFYWEYCSFSVFQNVFQSRFEQFQDSFRDVSMEDFAKRELEKLETLYRDDEYVSHPDFHFEIPEHFRFRGTNIFMEETAPFYKNLNSDVFFQLMTSFNKKKEFLKGLITEPVLPESLINEESTIHFTGSKTDFTELLKSIIELGHFEENQKIVVERMSAFLNVDITSGKNFDGLIQDLKKRGEVKYLNELSNKLYSYLNP